MLLRIASWKFDRDTQVSVSQPRRSGGLSYVSALEAVYEKVDRYHLILPQASLQSMPSPRRFQVISLIERPHRYVWRVDMAWDR